MTSYSEQNAAFKPTSNYFLLLYFWRVFLIQFSGVITSRVTAATVRHTAAGHGLLNCSDTAHSFSHEATLTYKHIHILICLICETHRECYACSPYRILKTLRLGYTNQSVNVV